MVLGALFLSYDPDRANASPKPAPAFSAYEMWAINQCDHVTHVFTHPAKRNANGTLRILTARPPRSWCVWTVLALRREGMKAGYATRPELAKLIYLESGYSPRADNPTSTAFGLGQFLDSTWRGVGCVRTTDPVWQMRCVIRYIASRYGGSPRAALAFHMRRNYY